MAASAALRSCVVVFPSLLSSSKSQFASSLALPGTNTSSRISMSAEWMPGQPRPPYLDGSAPGDFGFDPLRLGEVPENLERFKESELIHCRWAMLAVVSLFFPFFPISLLDDLPIIALAIPSGNSPKDVMTHLQKPGSATLD